MGCKSPRAQSVPSCRGYDIGDELQPAKVYCHFCKPDYLRAVDVLKRQLGREQDRTTKIARLAKQKNLTGASLQRQMTAISEQVLVDLFHDSTRGGTPPADFALMVCGSMARREMVAFSDIDAMFVLSNTDSRTTEYFQAVALHMSLRLKKAGDRGIAMSESNTPIQSLSGFQFCPGGFTPLTYASTANELVAEFARATDNHLRGGLFPRLVVGNEVLAKAYLQASEKAISEGAAGRAQNAVGELRALLTRHMDDLKEAKSSDLVVNLKTSIYRPVQLIPNEVAIYYGITAQGARAQIVSLVETKHMSLEVAQVFLETLESYAKVLTAVQLKANKEEQMVRMQTLAPNHPRYQDLKDMHGVDAGQRQSILSCIPRIQLIWRMTAEFVEQKSKKGLFASKKNPFLSKNPYAEFNVQRS